MLKKRVIPCLSLDNGGLVKTTKFKKPVYLGDPINAVKIFNDKEVDELVILDITATKEGREPDFELIESIAKEAFMPFAYGGGIKTIEHVTKLLKLGVEKVVLNSVAGESFQLVTEAAALAGNQSIVLSVDVKKNWRQKYNIYTHSGSKKLNVELLDYIKSAEKAGAGEILINAIDKDGTMEGFDLELIKRVSSEVNIPVVASGGAGRLSDLQDAVYEGGASAVSAGAFFVFHGKHRGILITYPAYDELSALFDN